MKDALLPLLSGDVLEEDIELSLADLCRACRLSAEQVFELVEEGIVEPLGGSASHWRFQGTSVYRVRRAVQLRRDLGVNWAGAALALDLLDELRVLRARVGRFEE
jgi:chaperone modulatory protein CbpM